MERTLSIKANYFADKLGYGVIIITTEGDIQKPAYRLSDSIEVINLNINFESIYGHNLLYKTILFSWKQILYRKRLRRALKEIKADITVSMLRREINFISDIDDGSKKVGEMHFNRDNYRDFSTNSIPAGLKKILSKIWMNQLVRNLKKLDSFVVLSKEDRDKWVELEQVEVIYNPLPEFPEKISDCVNKTVIAAGRFVRQKGFDMLLDAWALVNDRHPEWNLEIYGNGAKDWFINRADELGISDSVKFYDAVPDLNSKFAEASIFAFSSRYEGFGMVISEAMSCGLPPVAFACPCGPRDIITHGIDGFLVAPGDIEGLAEKICQLIDNESARKEIGVAARASSERFKIENIAKEWESLFTSLVN